MHIDIFVELQYNLLNDITLNNNNTTQAKTTTTTTTIITTTTAAATATRLRLRHGA